MLVLDGVWNENCEKWSELKKIKWAVQEAVES